MDKNHGHDSSTLPDWSEAESDSLRTETTTVQPSSLNSTHHTLLNAPHSTYNIQPHISFSTHFTQPLTPHSSCYSAPHTTQHTQSRTPCRTHYTAPRTTQHVSQTVPRTTSCTIQHRKHTVNTAWLTLHIKTRRIQLPSRQLSLWLQTQMWTVTDLVTNRGCVIFTANRDTEKRARPADLLKKGIIQR